MLMIITTLITTKVIILTDRSGLLLKFKARVKVPFQWLLHAGIYYQHNAIKQTLIRSQIQSIKLAMKQQEMQIYRWWHTMLARKVITLEFSTKASNRSAKNKKSFSNWSNISKPTILRYRELTQLRTKKRQKVGQVWTTWKSSKAPLSSKLNRHNLWKTCKRKRPSKNICKLRQSILIILSLAIIMTNHYPPRGQSIAIVKMILTFHVKK